MITKANDMHTYVAMKKNLIFLSQTCECRFQKKLPGLFFNNQVGINWIFSIFGALPNKFAQFKSSSRGSLIHGLSDYKKQ